jgi:hypothetical protein
MMVIVLQGLHVHSCHCSCHLVTGEPDTAHMHQENTHAAVLVVV